MTLFLLPPIRDNVYGLSPSVLVCHGRRAEQSYICRPPYAIALFSSLAQKPQWRCLVSTLNMFVSYRRK